MKIEDQTQTAEEVINSSQMEKDDEMFTFDHLSGISQTDMEQVVREIAVELETPLDVPAKALKLADPAVTANIRGAMGMTVQRELDEVIELTPR